MVEYLTITYYKFFTECQGHHLEGLERSTDPKDYFYYFNFFSVNCISETVLLLQEQYVM